ncbi:glycosyl transferase family 25 [Fadolivirus algeromassiliense]|jgi:GR25 family glycosyltransferase involved in LPS biosynthesis|uniref:Glycosyl transferase family 25 n=1 Tax=Fadolivirus FV1/VV64 TaxID=3070911 RepID=A0A7D3QUP9_9VIRU|nr:glycosyl transferase family 25 [Fadolivirus algeromassiliense]QKF94323.1 glycosyl transferase family 25 [Fadolivirus FV1/VV64]
MINKQNITNKQPAKKPIHVLNRYFNKIYVMYISDYELNRIKPKLEEKNIDVQYFIGSNARQDPLLRLEFEQYTNEHKQQNSKHYIKMSGAYGHILTSINIMEDAVANGYWRILILEPDIYFDEDFDNKVEKYLKMDFKLLYLGASQHNWKTIDDNNSVKMITDNYYYANLTYGTFAVALHRPAFFDYLRYLKMKLYASDACLLNLQKKWKEKCIVTYPNLIICDVTKSLTTDRKESQEEIAKMFRWNGNYDIWDKHAFTIETTKVYRVGIEINYYNKDLKCTFQLFNENGELTPMITIPNNLMHEKKQKILNGKVITCDEYHVYIYSTSPNVYIKTKNIFVDDIVFLEYFNIKSRTFKQDLLPFKNRFSRCLLSKNLEMKTYYLDLLEKLHKL